AWPGSPASISLDRLRGGLVGGQDVVQGPTEGPSSGGHRLAAGLCRAPAESTRCDGSNGGDARWTACHGQAGGLHGNAERGSGACPRSTGCGSGNGGGQSG